LVAATARAEDLAVKAEASSRTKSEFLAMMSHELRTPLNGVLGFAELLADSQLDPEQALYTQTIIASGDHLLAVVNDILDFSSIEKGTLAIEGAPFPLADLLGSAGIGSHPAAVDKGLDFRCEIAPGVPNQITGDQRRIRQILINLLNNAVKFTASGSVTLRIAPVVDADCHFLDFAVADTGIGISEATMDRLFQPFVQADRSMNRKFGGTGLGLAISRRIAEAMGGSLTVMSQVGHGSTFTFRLPLQSQPLATPDATTEVALSSDSSASSGIRVLVVDDDRIGRKLAGIHTQNLGHQAEFATNGQEAVKAYALGKFDVILMDVAMPVMDGLQATAKIRELEAGTGSHVPIIAVTANVMPGDRERFLACGMDEFLAKPFKRDALAAKLAPFINSRPN
jgi:CheY-like chemotaxis protein